MPNTPLESYFRINEENYGELKKELLAEIEALSSHPLSDELTAARENYILTSIAKGATVAKLPSRVADLTASQLARATRHIPDKQSLGWNDLTSLDAEDRRDFAEAAQKRPMNMPYELLFKEGQDDLVLPLFGGANSFDDLVDAFIKRHNVRAIENFEEAHRQDVLARQRDPGARPRAGINDIAQQRIRRNPDDLSRLQVCAPDKDGAWMPGPRFGAYLRKQREWRLFETVHRESEVRNKRQFPQEEESSTGRYAALKAFAERSVQNIDGVFRAGALRVVVSRDPQKIGEMSTGQDWLSCMSRDGSYFNYVSKDIETGSLVAYVVHQDDVEARYPLMRALLKPFLNADADMVLVPAKIYGVIANSTQTSDALLVTLNNFVAELNAEKTGAFKMDPRLYADGQALTVMLGAEWSPEQISSAIRKFQDGSLQEGLVELATNEDLLAKGMRAQHNADPAVNIRKLRKSIGRLFDLHDTELDLPWTFFREMMRTSIGAIPQPGDILEAVEKEEILLERQAAFNALASGDLALWEQNSKNWKTSDRLEIAYASAVTNEKGANKVQYAVRAYLHEAKKYLQDDCDEIALLQEVLQKFPDPTSAYVFANNHMPSRNDPTDGDYICGESLRLLGALVGSKPGLADAALITRLAQLALMPKKDKARDVLVAVLDKCPEFVDVAFNHFANVVRNAAEKPNDVYLAVKILDVLIKRHPAQADRPLVDALVKMATEIHSSYVGETALKTIKTLAARRPDLASASLIDAVAGLAYSKDEGCSLAALDAVGAMVFFAPHLANAGLVGRIADAAGLVTAKNCSAALKALGKIIYVRPDLATPELAVRLMEIAERNAEDYAPPKSTASRRVDKEVLTARRDALLLVGYISKKRVAHTGRPLSDCALIPRFMDVLTFKELSDFPAAIKSFVTLIEKTSGATELAFDLVKTSLEKNGLSQTLPVYGALVEKYPERANAATLDLIIKQTGGVWLSRALGTIGEIVSKRPDLAPSAVARLQDVFALGQQHEQEASIRGLLVVARHCPKVADKNLISFLFDVASTAEDRVRENAIYTAGEIIDLHPDLARSRYVSHLLKIAESDLSSDVCDAARAVADQIEEKLESSRKSVRPTKISDKAKECFHNSIA